MVASQEVDFYGQKSDLGQPLPAGLLSIIFSRCAQFCGAESSFFRDAVDTINPSSSRQQADEYAAAQTSVSTAVQVLASIEQKGTSCIAIVACCAAGGREELCRSVAVCVVSPFGRGTGPG